MYYGGAFPAEFNGVCIYPNIRQSAARWAYLDVKGSTFATRFGGDFILSEDLGFRPVDSCVGPDGALYVADWYDFHIAHRDTRDITKHYQPRKGDGRIWKVAATGAAAKPIFAGTPLRKRSSKELVGLLTNGNEWYVRQARVILGERRDKSVLPELEEMIFASPTQEVALAALWSHYVTAGLDEPLCQRLLEHPAEYVRAWTIRLLGDEGEVPEHLRAATGGPGRQRPECRSCAANWRPPPNDCRARRPCRSSPDCCGIARTWTTCIHSADDLVGD